MFIIDNFESTHFEKLKQIIRGTDTLYITSPFLSENIKFYDELFALLKFESIKKIFLTTTLDDYSPDLFKKANSLYFLSLGCIKNNIQCNIQIDNKLHGKIYIVESNNVPLKGIITSANFTDSGMKNKHEWGVMIDDSTQLLKVLDSINKSSIPVTYKEIEKIIKKIDSYKSKNQEIIAPKISLEVSSLYNKNNKSASIKNGLSKQPKYFIKPVGWAERHFDSKRKLSKNTEELHFAKRPAAISIGDIIICYGVGTTKILGYFEAISEEVNLQNGSRWPWIILAKNLCPTYSENWNLHDYTLARITKAYGQDANITFKGSKNLNGLQRGNDKIQLDEKFALHVIDIIKNGI
ncbi:restriction endonuclease PLD domain-containing protein [Priestia megaterium]|uniref:restriction endonuclease PLD domain-containing protein n=1 Tax=Priestia megaterium TaxID=1404 RepID=UPI001C23DA26|nr:restriction endonuclease PLD domain-containing protein [Priestia megaterium]MBU8754121.1 NgoFVII family restriction endonuclease [Priestia megaterium]